MLKPQSRHPTTKIIDIEDRLRLEKKKKTKVEKAKKMEAVRKVI